MKKVNWSAVVLVVFMLIIIGFITSLITSFYGNPVTKIIATSQIRRYVEKNYPDMDLEVSGAVYNFKFSHYASHVQSRSSIDTSFSVYWRKGKLEDSYQVDVVKHYKTFQRLQKELSDITEETIGREFRYKTSILFADIDKRLENYSDSLTLDMPLNTATIPLPTSLIIYFYDDKIDYEEFAQRLLELSEIMERNQIRIDYYTVVMSKTLEEDEKPLVSEENIHLYDFPAERLDSETLADDIREYIDLWEKENEK